MSVTENKKDKDSGLAETIKVVVQALLLALIVRTFLFQPFNIPSGSMKDTLPDWRLSIRLQIQLWIFPLFLPFRPGPVQRPHLVFRTGTR